MMQQCLHWLTNGCLRSVIAQITSQTITLHPQWQIKGRNIAFSLYLVKFILKLMRILPLSYL